MTDDNPHLLLVEDSPADARFFREMLRGDPYSLTHVTRLEAALDALAGTSFHLVLLDLGLPDSKGLETLVQTLRVSARIPVVVLTGLADEETGLQAVRSGAQDYLVKGQVDRTHLIRTIRYAMERKQVTETLLQDNTELFRKVSTTAKDAIILMDHNGKISMWNEAAERIFGYPSDKAIGQDLHQLVAPKRYLSQFKAGHIAFLQTGKGTLIGQTIEMPASRKDGQEFPVELSISAFQDQDRWHALAIVRDVSERKYAQRLDQLSETITSVGRMAHLIAKEVDHPLARVVEGLENLKQNFGQIAPGSGLFRKIESVEKDVAKVCHLSRELLSFSRVDNLYPVNLDIRTLLDDALVLLRHKMGNITLQRFFPQHAQVIADPVKLEQVFYHLLANAAEAMPKGGTITMTIIGAGSQLETIIEDTGPGIPEPALSKVFDPYFTTKENEGGTGLGLSICHRIVHLHSGSIGIANGTHGGAKVTVRLPTTTPGMVSPEKTVTAESNPDTTLRLNQIFTVLSSPIRRRLLELLGEKGASRLMEMVDQLIVRDHTIFLFHLRSLRETGLVTQNAEKKYILTPSGKEVHTYSTVLKRQLTTLHRS